MPRKNNIRILVVDDEPDVLELVVFHLEKEAYQVDVADTGDKALKMARENLPSLLVLDLMLPGINGLEICRLLKRDPKTRDIPILMLTARAAEENRIKGLELGAHDYVTKPFSPRELALRVDSVLRRAGVGQDPEPTTVLTDGDLVLDTSRHEVTRAGKTLALTAREFDLLRFLLAHPGTAWSREDLLGRVWGWSVGDLSTVTVHVRRLREKVETDPKQPARLVTVWGVGYRWEPSSA